MAIVTKLGLLQLCVPHLAKGLFLPKNQTLQNVFLMLTLSRQNLDIISDLKIGVIKRCISQKCGTKL